jgi:hypothetical protein
MCHREVDRAWDTSCARSRIPQEGMSAFSVCATATAHIFVLKTLIPKEI